MAAYRLSPQERATMYARKVDLLFVRNRDYFLSYVETFTQTFTQAERMKRGREKEAEQSHFDPPKLPGSDAFEYWRPGPDPTAATMVTLLAALHDECLPDRPPILDLASGTYTSAFQSRDPGLRALWGARVWCIEARVEKQGATDRLDALETYLSRARADIEAAAKDKPTRAAIETALQDRLTRDKWLPGCRALAKEYGLAGSTIRKTTAWGTWMLQKGRKNGTGGRPAVKSLTPKLLASIGKQDTALERLKAEQKMDDPATGQPDASRPDRIHHRRP